MSGYNTDVQAACNEMGALLTELKQALRRLLRCPGYSFAVFVTLTLGLSLSVGMYTVLNGVVLKGLPFPGGERVVEISAYNFAQNALSEQLTPAEAVSLVQSPVFEHAGWFMWGGETLLGGERPREITVQRVSDGFFQALGVQPRLGRPIGADDVGPDGGVVVLSDEEWERLSSRDPAIIGHPLRLEDRTVTVIGVMPPGFSTGAGMWLAVNPESLTGNAAAFSNARYLSAFGKLVDGKDVRSAASALDILAAQIRNTHRLPDDGWRLEATSMLDLVVGDARGVLAGVFAVSLVVLAIACANVGSLLAARLSSRGRELAIIQALGATSTRVWCGVLLELLILALLAGGTAMLLLLSALEIFRTQSAGILPRADEIALDPGVAGFAAGIALLCVMLVAVPFGMRLRNRMAGNLQAGRKAIGGAMRALPVVGLGLATMALVAGAAVALSLERLRAVDPGFRTDNIYAIQMFHGGGPDEWRRFAVAVLERMKAEPDIERVTVTTAPPLTLVGGFSVDVQVPEREQPESMQAGLRRVTPDYLRVLSQPLLRGREFMATDDIAATKVAIVNETFAHRVFGDVDVVGRAIGLPLADGPRVEFRIVGVTADIRNAGLRRPAEPEILIPFMQSPWVGVSFLAYAPQAGSGLLERMQEAIWAVDPNEAMSRVYRLQDEIDVQLAQVMYFTRVLGGFALLAALLAAFGTYSVIALMQRRQVAEIGVRLALGARPVSVARRVIAQGLSLALVAGFAGSLGSIVVLRLLRSQLYGVEVTSPQLYILGIGGALVAALLATAVPAWRAARIQPIVALRHE